MCLYVQSWFSNWRMCINICVCACWTSTQRSIIIIRNDCEHEWPANGFAIWNYYYYACSAICFDVVSYSGFINGQNVRRFRPFHALHLLKNTIRCVHEITNWIEVIEIERKKSTECNVLHPFDLVFCFCFDKCGPTIFIYVLTIKWLRNESITTTHNHSFLLFAHILICKFKYLSFIPFIVGLVR